LTTSHGNTGTTAEPFHRKQPSRWLISLKEILKWAGLWMFLSSATMVRSGNTRREIKKLQVSETKVVVGIANHNHHAKIHNEGGKIPVTPKMRRFFWAKYKETGKEYWKGMALTKKTHFDIPQRKFIGDSKALEKTLDRMLISELRKALS
jgi:phage gpG-like protein